ncbi:hypothetical protein J8J27_24435, partial [Mycobacterium tuberculosis]|nr:hypothetical protein [Mycobacterium tuberculosis]
VNGATFDLGLGTDTLITDANGATVTVSGAESIQGAGDDDVITLQGIVTGAQIDLGGAATADSLTFTDATTVTVYNVESITGSAHNSSVTLGNAMDGALDLGLGIDTLTLAN